MESNRNYILYSKSKNANRSFTRFVVICKKLLTSQENYDLKSEQQVTFKVSIIGEKMPIYTRCNATTSSWGVHLQEQEDLRVTQKINSAHQATAIQLAGEISTLFKVINAGWLLASSVIWDKKNHQTGIMWGGIYKYVPFLLPLKSCGYYLAIEVYLLSKRNPQPRRQSFGVL